MNKIKIILMIVVSLFVFAGCSSDPGKIKLDYSAVENNSNTNKINIEKSVIDDLNKSAPDIVYLDRINYSEKFDKNDKSNIYLEFHLKEDVKEDYDTYKELYQVLIPIMENAKYNNIDNVVFLVMNNSRNTKMLAVTISSGQIKKLNITEYSVNAYKDINIVGDVNGRLYSKYK